MTREEIADVLRSALGRHEKHDAACEGLGCGTCVSFERAIAALSEPQPSCQCCAARGCGSCEGGTKAPRSCQHARLLRYLADNGMSRCGRHELGEDDSTKCTYRDGICDAHSIEEIAPQRCAPAAPGEEWELSSGGMDADGDEWRVYRKRSAGGDPR